MQVKETAFWLAYRSGALSLFRSTATRIDALNKRLRVLPLPERGVLIYMLHRLTTSETPLRRGTDVGLFERFCAHLAEHYEVLPLVELEHRRRSGKLPSRAVALTFDDGHADNYELGLPILRRYNLPATVFVTTGFINRRVIPWSTRLALMLEHAKPPGEPLVLDGVDVQLASLSERFATQLRLVAHLQHMEHGRTEALLEELTERLDCDVAHAANSEMLTWEQLREMHAAGFTSGAHTVTHPFLTRIPVEQAKREMQESKEEIEGRVGCPVETFAYPNGKANDYDANVMQAAREVGFSLAVTALFGANDAARSPYDLRRVSLYGDLPGEVVRLERYFYAAVDRRSSDDGTLAPSGERRRR